MSRVFLSFLGTNDYLPCTYYRDKKEVQNVRFVQEAIMKTECGGWSARDRALIFATEEAYHRNWRDNGHTDWKTGEAVARKGLKCCLADMALPFPCERVEIPHGTSESQIWDIFSVVFDHLKSGEEVTVDITHAFRSLPMLAIVILNYAKVLKDITLKGVFYGAFEVLGPISKLSNIPVEDRRAPILELTAFDQLLEWSFAIHQFLIAGNAEAIRRAARNDLKSILKESRGKDEGATALRGIGDRLAEYGALLSTCRGKEISGAAVGLAHKIEGFNRFELLPAFRPLFDRLHAKLSPFGRNTLRDGISAARWCLDHNLIQQGYTILLELLVSYFIEQVGADFQDVAARKIASNALGIAVKQLPPSRWNQMARRNPELTAAYLKHCKSEMELVKIWRDLSNGRNDLNHAGFRDSPRSAGAFRNQLNKVVERLEAYALC